MAGEWHLYWKLQCFLVYGAINSGAPFIILLYKKYHLSTFEIGWLNAIAPIAASFAAPLWALFADNTGRHRDTLLVLSLISTCIFSCLYFCSSFVSFLLVIFFMTVFAAPLLPFLDSYIIQALGSNKSQYGRVRLYGSIACGVLPMVMGQIIDATSLDAIFVSNAVGMVLFLLASFRLPRVIAPLVQDTTPMATKVKEMLSSQMGLFLFTVLMLGIGFSIINGYLFLFLIDELAASNTLLGLAVSCTILTEIPFFFFSQPLLDKVGVRMMIILAHVAFAVRVLCYALLQNAWLVLPIQILHGVIYSLFWSAAVTHMNQLAPPGMEATSIALLSAVFGGVAAAVGSLLGSHLYNAFGPRAMFVYSGIAILASALFFWFTYQKPLNGRFYKGGVEAEPLLQDDGERGVNTKPSVPRYGSHDNSFDIVQRPNPSASFNISHRSPVTARATVIP